MHFKKEIYDSRIAALLYFFSFLFLLFMFAHNAYPDYGWIYKTLIMVTALQTLNSLLYTDSVYGKWKIVDSNLELSGGRLAKISLEIDKIKYVYRVKKDSFGFTGKVVVIISRNGDQFTFSYLEEKKFSDEVLQGLCLKLVEVNKAIELDPDYKLLIEGRIDLSDSVPEKMIEDVERIMVNKGEKTH